MGKACCCQSCWGEYIPTSVSYSRDPAGTRARVHTCVAADVEGACRTKWGNGMLVEMCLQVQRHVGGVPGGTGEAKGSRILGFVPCCRTIWTRTHQNAAEGSNELGGNERKQS